MFTRRHYVAIAEVLKQYSADEDAWIEKHGDVWVTADGDTSRPRAHIKLAQMFAADNPRFDMVKFFDACEPVE